MHALVVAGREAGEKQGPRAQRMLRTKEQVPEGKERAQSLYAQGPGA